MAHTRSLLEVDPDLGHGLDDAQRVRARDASTVAVGSLRVGAWRPPTEATLLVLDGLIVRDVALGGQVATQLLGPGDVVDTADEADALFAMQVLWRVAHPAQVVVITPAVLASLPAVVAHNLLRRAGARSARLATTQAISQLPRVDDRVLALFGQLAERWGRVTPAGILVALPLKHSTIGRMVGAARPTVTLALKGLAMGGALVRTAEGWMLDAGALDRFVPEAPSPSEGTGHGGKAPVALSA